MIKHEAARWAQLTGRGIAHNLRRHYSPWLLRGVVTLLLVANIISSGVKRGPLSIASFPWIGFWSCFRNREKAICGNAG